MSRRTCSRPPHVGEMNRPAVIFLAISSPILLVPDFE
jgi:hypothetical protein